MSQMLWKWLETEMLNVREHLTDQAIETHAHAKKTVERRVRREETKKEKMEIRW